jgi:hypothetical protein
MGCNYIKKGRKLPCNTGVGGYKNVFFVEYVSGLIPNLLTDSSASDIYGATALEFGLSSASFLFGAGGTSSSGATAGTGQSAIREVYQYEVKNTGDTYDETSETDENIGNTIYTGELKLVLPKLDKESINQVRLLTYNKSFIILETYSGYFLLVGAENGAILSQSVKKLGGAMKDFQGVELNFKTEERIPYVYLKQEAIDILKVNIADSIQPI